MSPKPLIRWTIGDVHQEGYVALAASVKAMHALYGDAFDYVICHNHVHRKTLDHLRYLPAELYAQTGDELPLPARGPAWKLYPPRLRPDGHEILIDNDLILRKRLGRMDKFLKHTDKVMFTQSVFRNYGRFAHNVGIHVLLNSGLIGLPPGYDFQAEVLATLKAENVTEWRSKFDEQGLVASLLQLQPNFKIPLWQVMICDNEITEDLPVSSHGHHFVGLNAGETALWDKYQALTHNPLWVMCHPGIGADYLCDLLNATGVFPPFCDLRLKDKAGPLQRGVAFNEWLRCFKHYGPPFIYNAPPHLKCSSDTFNAALKDRTVNHVQKYLPGVKFISFGCRDVYRHAVSQYFAEKEKTTSDMYFDEEELLKAYGCLVDKQQYWSEFLGGEPTLLVFYEDLAADPAAQLRRIADFADLPLTETTIATAIKVICGDSRYSTARPETEAYVKQLREVVAAKPLHIGLRTAPAKKYPQAIALQSRRGDFLGTMPSGGKVAEIGVHYGHFARRMYDINKPAELHLVDAWDYIPNAQPQQRFFDIPDRDKEVSRKFKKELAEKRVKMWKMYSEDAVKHFEDGYFDWIYIDANHRYLFVKQDLEMWHHKVHPSGFLTGHDYNGWYCPGVVQAVDEFLQEHDDWEMVYLTRGDKHPSWAVRRKTPNSAAISRFAGKHAGSRCFILGSGPSLNDMDLSPLQGETLIGVNSLYNHPLPMDYMVVSDPSVWRNHHQGITQKLETDGATLFLSALPSVVSTQQQMRSNLVIPSLPTHPRIINIPRSEYLPYRPLPENWADVRQGLYSRGTVVIGAIQLAFYMGFTEVHLLGCDCHYPTSMDHFDGSEVDGVKKRGKNDWERTFKHYKLCKDYFERHGRKIFNATKGGKLEVFEREEFDTLWK